MQKSPKEKMPGRGVESMLRHTARNQINLIPCCVEKTNKVTPSGQIVTT